MVNLAANLLETLYPRSIRAHMISKVGAKFQSLSPDDYVGAWTLKKGIVGASMAVYMGLLNVYFSLECSPEEHYTI